MLFLVIIVVIAEGLIVDKGVKQVDELVVTTMTRRWCKLPYPDHKDGCPNWNDNPTCPLKVPLIYDLFNVDKKVWLAYCKFDLEEFENRMEERHPDWTSRQKRCLLYWQDYVDKVLRNFTESFIEDRDEKLHYTMKPEAHGVDLFRTIWKNDCFNFRLKVHPEQYVYKISLIGVGK